MTRGPREGAEPYRALFHSVDLGVCVFEMLYWANGRPVDYRFLEVNPTFAQHTGLVDPVGKTARELVPDLEEHWIEIYGRVAESGEPHRFEQGSAAMGRWFEVNAVRVGGAGSRTVALVFADITPRKRAEEALRSSEERTRLAIQVAHLGTWRYVSTTDLVELDDRMREIWGEPPDAATIPLTAVLERIHPDDRARVAESVGAMLDPRSPGSYEIDYRVVWPDGSERWVAATGQAQFPADGATQGAVVAIGTALDITERKRAEVALRESAERQTFLLALDAALRSLADPVAIQAEAARVLGERLGVTRAFYAEAEADGDHVVVRQDYHDGVPSAAGRYRIADFGAELAAAFRAGRTLVVDDIAAEHLTEAERAAYDAVDVRAHATVCLVKAGRLVALLGLHQATPRAWSPADVALIEETAERTWSAVERARAETALRAAEEDRQRLLDALAHDLKNPLAALRGQAQLVRRQIARRGVPDAVSLDERVAGFEALAIRMTELVEELGDHSRLAAGQEVELRPEPTELGALVRDAVAETSSTTGSSPIRLEVEAGAEGIVGEWDPRRLRRVVTNLLSNAVKYSPAGGEVEVRLARAGGAATLQVRDRGIGIPAGDLPHVFAFGQRGGNVGQIAGSGIGLAGAKRIVDQHGGTIAVESAEGVGTTVTVRLPLEAGTARRQAGKG